MVHQYMPKFFHDPHKNPPALPPTHLMNGPLSWLTAFSQIDFLDTYKKWLH